MDITPLDDDVALLFSCIQDSQFGLAIYYASFALYIFDYALTFNDEIRFIWLPRRVTANSIFYVITRYAGFLCILGVVIWPTPTLFSELLAVVLRLITIVASEVILALRTWAIWERNRFIAFGLVALSIACVTPAGIIVSKDVTSTKYVPVAPNASHIAECVTINSQFSGAYIYPYLLTIVFECVVLGLCLIKIVRLRRATPGRIPLVERLWKDGMLYFFAMMLLSVVNIVLVVQSASPRLRSGASQLQAVLHSIVSTRILLHLAAVHRDALEALPSQSDYTWPSSQQFTSRFSFGNTVTTTIQSSAHANNK